MSVVEEIDQIPHPERLMVSICMITFRHEAFVEEAIQGVLSQELEGSFELVISDDMSPDSTRAICIELQKRHPEKIRLLLPKKNLGMTRNLEQALDKCRGKYVAFCEGDDVWTDPFKLAKQVMLLETDATCTGTYHETRMITEAGESTGRLFREDLPDKLTLEGLMLKHSPFHTSSFLFRASPIMHALPVWLLHVASLDMALFTLFTGEGLLRKVEGVMSSYRKHPGGITNTSINNGSSYHLHRILLWLFIDRHLNYQYTVRCQELFLDHWQKILCENTPRQRLRSIRGLFRKNPGWFLRHPTFTMARLRECLRR